MKPKLQYTDIRVLVVDDHGHIRKAMMKLISQAGANQVDEASNGAQAIRMLEEGGYDAVILDIYMPKVDGFEVIEHIRAQDIRNDIPIIVVSGEANRADIVKATELGASEYLIKPFKKDEFVQKVNTAIVQYFAPTELIKIMRDAERMLSENKLQEAFKYAQAAFKQEPFSLRALNLLAITLARLDRAEEALKLINQGIDANPEHYKFHATKANLLFQLKREREAIDSMGRELEINPKQIARQILMAEHQMKAGNPVAAIDHFREALKEKPKHKKSLLGMANAYFQNSDLDKTLYYLSRYRRQHPHDKKPLIAIIRYCKMANQNKKAEHAIKTEINNFPNRFDAYVALAVFYIQMKKEDAAMLTLENLLEKDPENPEGHTLRGSIFMGKGDYKSAESDFLMAAKISPSLDTLVPLARARLKLKKPREFLVACQRALFFGSTDRQVISLLAQAYLVNGEFTKAYLLGKKAMVLGANNQAIRQIVKTAFDGMSKRRQSRKPVAS